MFRRCLHPVLVLVALCFVACEKQPDKKPVEQVSSITKTNEKTYVVKGVVKEVKSDFTEAKIKHEEVPGYMPAMTMDFAVKNTNELRGLKSNDVVSFRMVVTDDDAWIDHVKKLNATPPTEAPSRQSVRIVRDVDPLNVGDLVPNYHLTNELGQAVSLADFKGKAVAMTFIFTSCLYPTYCPRMSLNFGEVQKKLVERANGTTNWHLLTVTFDPVKDTPSVLKQYAGNYGYDPAHWSFLTGDLVEITALSEQMGQMFWREGGTINHNLRTVVIDPEGHLSKIFSGNEWKADELVAEVLKVAKGESAK